MTVLDLIKKSAVILNVDDIASSAILDTVTPENEATILQTNFTLNRLFELTKVMLNEITTYYAPIAKSVIVNAVDKKIALSSCPQLLKIIGIKRDEVFVKYRIVDENIEVAEDGEFEIIYHQIPAITSLLNKIQLEGVSDDLLVDGLNAYYCLTCGLFSDFSVYNQKYSNKLTKLRTLPLFSMPCRSWE